MRVLAPLTLAFLLACSPAFAQKDRARNPRILNAKTVYFFNRTGSEAVGAQALAALKKWNKFQIVTDRNQADLIFLLECDPYLGGNILYSGGQTGTIDREGQIAEDPVPNYTRHVRRSTLISTSLMPPTVKAYGAPTTPGAACSQGSIPSAPA